MWYGSPKHKEILMFSAIPARTRTSRCKELGPALAPRIAAHRMSPDLTKSLVRRPRPSREAGKDVVRITKT